MGNNFGRLFRLTTFGESHGVSVGAVIDGCPAGLMLDASDIQIELDRRRPGQSAITTQRKEADRVRIVSGTFEGRTLGTPLTLIVDNADHKSADYEELRTLFRPSHADYTYHKKYGHRAHVGGGRASARETIGRVAAGAVAGKVLQEEGIEVLAWVKSVADIEAPIDPESSALTRSTIDANILRCPHPETAIRMESAVRAARKDGDSLGGVVECVVRGTPPGLGEPVFDKLEAVLGAAILSIPACKGFESGSGFSGTRMRGSEHNDLFYSDTSGRIRTRTNFSGGIQGGISNGECIVLRAAFKPTATIMKPQDTVHANGVNATYKGRGRHDPCVLPRAVPIVEAMVKLVLADMLLIHRAHTSSIS